MLPTVLYSIKNGILNKIKTVEKDSYFPSALTSDTNNNLFHVKLQKNIGQIVKISDDKTENFNITISVNNTVRAILADSDGNIWMGTDSGLIQYRKRFIQVFASVSDDYWLSTRSIIESADKSVWITSGQKLLRWKENKLETIETWKSNLTASAIDKSGNLWIGTQNGYAKFDKNRLTEFEDTFLYDPTVTSLFFDDQNTLWIGKRGSGLQELKGGNLKNYSTSDGLVNNSISFITQDRNGVFWIGTLGGLSRFENGFFTNYTTENGLPNNNVRDFYQDEDGTIWIGTYGGGLSRFKDNVFTNISSANGLAENIVSRILVDDNDNFWILGNQGIYSVSRKILNDFADGKTKRIFCAVYNINDGMKVSEGNGGIQHSGWKTHDGKLWFTMIQGAVAIDPKQINNSKPNIYIEEIFLNNEKINPKEELLIDSNQNNLVINYTGLTFYKSNQVQFRYKLDGYDTDWQEVGTRRSAYYPYLPPGNYTFKVVAISANGNSSENQAFLKIEVKAPFWRTWWFILLVIAILLTIILLAFKKRLDSMHKVRLKQQEFSRQLINAHETERKRIAAEFHDSLGQNLLVIRNWALLGLNDDSNSEKSVKHLKVISEAASSALDETRSIIGNLRPPHLQRFGLTETLINMVKRIEESSRIFFQTNIENIDNLFEPDEELSIYRIVQECLNNIVKHSEAQNAKVIIKLVKGKIEFTNSQERIDITITDNGKGFTLKPNSDSNVGLDNIFQRVELLGGKYSIKSDLNIGTQIKVHLIVRSKTT